MGQVPRVADVAVEAPPLGTSTGCGRLVARRTGPRTTLAEARATSPLRFVVPTFPSQPVAGRVAEGTETLRLRLVRGDPAVDLSASPNLIAFVPGVRPVAIVLEPN